MLVRPHHSLARGMAALFLLLVAACAPPLEQGRLPGDGGLRTVEQMKGQSQRYARMGRTALDAGDVNSAAGLFEQALLLDGDNAKAALGLGDALLRQNRPQEASEVYGRAFFQEGARAHYGYGRAMVALGRPETAIKHLKQAYDLAPTDTTVLNVLGVAYDLAGQHDAAVQAYREGLAMAPDDRGLKSNLGLSQALAGDTEAAIATLRPLTEGADSDKRARQNLALAYGLKGDVLAADRLSRVDLNEDEVRRNLAIFAALRGTDGALAAMTLAPDLTAPPLSPKREPRRLNPISAITSATQADCPTAACAGSRANAGT
jgi:Flp pilus assembly protein TadD